MGRVSHLTFDLSGLPKAGPLEGRVGRHVICPRRLLLLGTVPVLRNLAVLDAEHIKPCGRVLLGWI